MIVPLLLALAVQDTVVLKPVVVTATRVPTRADAVTAAVTVISGASLRDRGVRTVADALRETLGATIVETNGPGSQTSLFLRGGESDYVKVLLDGVSLNQPGGAYTFAHLTTDDVERIEIVRGPVSVLYGSDAVAGVVQIFTRTGLGGVPRVDAEAGAGSYGMRRVGGTITGGTAGFAYSLGFSRVSTDGLFPINSGYRNTTVTTRLRVAPDARSDAAVTVRHGDGVFHYPTDGAGRVVDANQVAADRGPAVAVDIPPVSGHDRQRRPVGRRPRRPGRYDLDLPLLGPRAAAQCRTAGELASTPRSTDHCGRGVRRCPAAAYRSMPVLLGGVVL